MRKYILTALLISVFTNCFSNNITITNTTLVGKNTVANYVMIQFDLSWENSWRSSSGPSNWDAAWVFIKYKIKGQVDWYHASLNYVNGTGAGDGHTVPSGAIIKGANDTGENSTGVFIYSFSDKAQSQANYPGVQLQWQYGDDGVQDSDLVEICVFGIEMVYVPQGAFEIGKLSDVWHSFYTYSDNTSAFPVSSESLITVGNSVGELYYDNGGDKAGPIPGGFPKGYKPFYCMKYEITQEQYVEFLLKLNSTQAGARAYTSGGNRHAITGTYGSFDTDSPYVACNYLSWADLSAYLDWAGLRPMTELEFEKACRGTLPAITAEFAWGSTLVVTEQYSFINLDQENEGVSDAYNVVKGNCSSSNTDGSNDGPLRVGIFAAHEDNIGRVTSGATYYGIMEMTGNVYEQTVTVGNATGRLFTNANGDGSLDANGNANTISWPGTDAVGAGVRGGSWNLSTLAVGHSHYVSGRTLAVTGAANRLNDRGGRGVRSAP